MKLGHTTIFPNLDASHLYKDVGLFAAALGKVDNTTATIIHFGVDEVEVPPELTHLLKTKCLCPGHGAWHKAQLLNFLRSGRADSVTLYHPTRQNFVFAFFLRLFGLKVYLKLDLSLAHASSLTKSWNNPWRVRSWLTQTFFGVPNIISCEDKEIFKLLKVFPWASRKLHLIPNGMLNEATPLQIDFNIPRDDVIVIAGRLGAKEKNNQVVLDALRLIPQGGLGLWRIHFCGKASFEFTHLVELFIVDRPDLADSIVLRGELNRSEILTEYRNGKILLVTSHSEAFSLAALEAAWYGCFLASTPVGGMAQLTDNWSKGICLPFNDVVYLSKFIERVVVGNIEGMNDFAERVDFVRETFGLEKLAQTIISTLRS
ncbi:glycosyltransferase family 4 protein [Hydrogenophaga sp.]|uniref:glycosyltransferase family 4 protein n=1 Tax=Hydrogenophaga sp. TaxID=1904254 RepID=UPI002731E240|nr:glycosyltransferase [Hydrogenophaga sp.]MDP1684476.1 glycosyltransferase [Hydrogenophaga sp.]